MVMQMMALGKVVVSTAVDGIPDYISHKKNGLLIRATEEPAIINEGIELLTELISQPSLKKTIGENSRQYAIKHFSHDGFCSFYSRMLTNDK